MTEWNDHDTWEFIDPDGEKKLLEHQPRFTTRSMPALMEAVRAGVGVGLILEQVCAQDVRSGKLVQLLPDWQTTEGRVYLVFTTARGMPPAVRALIDFLVEGFRGSAEVVSKIDAQARGLIDAEA
jgi:DNA-binding transcriptional LysR family regulator